MKQPVVYFHTHWDREWYQPFRAYQVRLAEVVDDILERVESGVLSCFTLDGQTVLLDDYLELRPQNRERLQRLIKTSKLSIGPWYVMPDEFLVSGESLLRNLQRGIRDSHAWGCHEFAGYLPDTFGHSADMPMLLRQFGVDNAIVWRGVNPGQSEFNWRSPSGDQVLGYHLADGYFQMMLHMSDTDPDLGEFGKSGLLNQLSKKLSQRAVSNRFLLPVGGDHLGPLDSDGVSVLRQTLPQAEVSTPDQFFKRFHEYLNGQKINLPQFTGELTDNSNAFLLPGVYSARVYLKQANRKLEHVLLRQWEPLTVMSRLAGNERYEQELAKAWELLLLNHPHDSICGCSVDAVHRENEVRFDQVAALAQSVITRQQSYLAEKLATTDQWLVLNFDSQPFTGVVPVYTDDRKQHLDQWQKTEAVLADEFLTNHQSVPLAHKTVQRHQGWIWLENIPPLGQVVVNQREKRTGYTPVSADNHSLENEFYHLSVESDGTLTIFEKLTNKTYSGLHSFRDVPQQGDSYNAAPIPGKPHGGATLKKYQTTAKGPLVGMLELTYQLNHPKLRLITQIRLEAGNPLVQFETTFVNTAPDHQLQVGFPTGQAITQVQAESHFSVVTRCYDPAFKVEASMPTPPWTEIKPNTGPIQRFIAANRQAWITEGICEYEVHQDTLYLTLFRGFDMLSKADTGVRGAQAGPPLPTPEGQCLNRSFSLRYAWLPEKPPNELFTWSNRFYGSIAALSGKKTSKMKMAANALDAPSDQLNIHNHCLPTSLLHWNNPTIVMSACCVSQEGHVTIRLLNLSDQTQQVTISPGFTYHLCKEIRLLEQPVDPQDKPSEREPGASLNDVRFAPFQLRSWIFTLE